MNWIFLSKSHISYMEMENYGNKCVPKFFGLDFRFRYFPQQVIDIEYAADEILVQVEKTAKLFYLEWASKVKRLNEIEENITKWIPDFPRKIEELKKEIAEIEKSLSVTEKEICTKILDALVHQKFICKDYLKGDGLFISIGDKCWQKMRVVKAWKWQGKDSAALAIFAAELAVANQERDYPHDDRPCALISAAKKVLENNSEENRYAVEELLQGWSFWNESMDWPPNGYPTEDYFTIKDVYSSAVSAARVATWPTSNNIWSTIKDAVKAAAEVAARAAKNSIEAAVEAAARPIEDAATEKFVWPGWEEGPTFRKESAAYATWSAARNAFAGTASKDIRSAVRDAVKAAPEAAKKEILQQCEEWVQKHIGELEEIEISSKMQKIWKMKKYRKRFTRWFTRLFAFGHSPLLYHGRSK